MIVQEEIPYTLEEVKAMSQTIRQLRKEKSELIEMACEWLRCNCSDYICSFDEDSYMSKDFINDFRKAMEIKQ